ncbi:hypothetical protein [Magnetospira sp. QH-2]|uniref:hypothetical protein n=1 Tax=Magnetospira sp. (strain QH-2) TaxID=1288970 RepID=UPI0003E81A03|nr:hypothetical protein [Magnetospira sp. QH-2]CCQ72187.1 conserved protein of unknown function [Magnetospira sp. QH-2]
MAKPEQIPTDLAIDLGDDLSPEDFVAAVRNFLGYVGEITDSQRGDGSDIHWTVRVREGSALVGVEPNASAPHSRLAMIYKKAAFGPTALAKGNIKEAALSEKALGHLKNLSELASRHENGRGVNLWVERKPISIGTGIARVVKEDWQSDYYDFGTIEGRLEAIMDSAGSLKIRIKDFLYPRAINCVVPEKLIEMVLTSFRRRVEIEGRIHYRRDGTPISIEAQIIEVLPEDDELPTADDVRGIMANV